MLALGYVRVSTDDQNPALQRRALRQYAQARRWRLELFEDLGVSGLMRRRPGLERLMRRIGRPRPGRASGAVLVWKFDRFSRSTAELLSALEQFRVRGVDFVSVTEGIDTSTPYGQMVYTMVAAIAEFERAQIRERVRAGVDAARAAGRRWGRMPRMIPLPSLLVARSRIREGISLRTVATDLGVPRTTLRRHLATLRLAPAFVP
jgi:DNA invertase Pin-like site-specific DNA recombinase